MPFNKDIFKDLLCPNCFSRLIETHINFKCHNQSCLKEFPLVDGIPILIDESKSIFNISDFLNKRTTTFQLKESKTENLIKKIIPSISNNLKAKSNYSRLLSLLLKNVEQVKVLVIGGSIIGEGMEDFINEPNLSLVESDVSFGPRTKIIFDAHSIPFPNEYFDCVILQAVLEHVVDPYQCVKEVHRVLKNEGLVYAETPFIQQVHMGKFDFHRFTQLGHRRLFREFSEVDSGAVCGSGMALAWTYSYFIFSFLKSRRVKKLFIPFTRFTSFFWKYFDHMTINNPGTIDSASGFYFIGKKSDTVLEDRELLKQYRGLF
ncbi:MAG: class I SAM-dependent methyltransferase [bacterium]|nr:class I SAM-dependent methyltransferase [bacterium]